MRSGCAALLIVISAACYSPSPPEGLVCASGNRCPDGQTCAADGRCYSTVLDGAPPAGDGGCTAAGQRATFAARLAASDAMSGDNFGDAMALDGAWLALGVNSADDLAEGAGAVYMFERDGSTWVQRQKLTASNGDAQDRFGAAVALDGTRLLVGAPDAGTPARGLVYAFEYDGSAWVERQILDAGGEGGDGFGTAVALHGDHAAVGAPGAGGDTGAVYAYDRGASAWEPAGDYIPSDAAAAFGAALAIDDTTLAVGTPEDDDAGQFSGSVFLLARDGSTWVSSGKLTASDAAANDNFGSAVALDGGRLVVGAPFRGDIGAVYLYDGPGFGSEQVVSAADLAAGDGFGRSVALRGDLLAVGAPSDDDGGTSTGSAYLLARAGDAWVEVEKLVDEEGAEFDIFGSQVALGDGELLVGAPLYDGGGLADSGAVLLYTVACP